MARTTISIPDDLKNEMDKAGDDTNWSGIAAEAFRNELNRIKARSATKGKAMNAAAMQRLKASKATYLGQAADRGYEDGIEWASKAAEYEELSNLHSAWQTVETCETNDAYGAPGAFLTLIRRGDDARVDRSDINEFWENLAKGSDDTDQYSAPYWDGFAKGSIEVFEKFEDQS